MLLKKRKIKWLKQSELLNAIAYRLPLQVREVVVYKCGDCYPKCPRCGQSLDREYVNFCDRCGQRLVWHLFINGSIYERYLE